MSFELCMFTGLLCLFSSLGSLGRELGAEMLQMYAADAPLHTVTHVFEDDGRWNTICERWLL